MNISLNWLKQYVDIPKDLSPQDLALKLTMSVVEVEGIVDQSLRYEHIVVGEVVNVVDHPQADKLKVCKVKSGSGEHQVICGAKNVYPGMKSALALPGALVKWHGQGDLVKLEKTKIRGVESEGMLCAPSEIDLADIFREADGVVDFKEGKAGQPVAELLVYDDVIFEIDNKSVTHRSDLWGHYGIAREIAALLGKKIKPLEITEKIQEGDQVKLNINIQDKENCSRYIGAVMGKIKIEPSPLWLQNLLKSAGIRPINNVIDVTNFVMLELGRPSHAFDRREMKEDTIIIRRAKDGEKFTTLDGVERQLDSTMCLVCDAHRPTDLGGIMGGLNSEIKKDTTEIILELANFNPSNIRKTSTRLGLRTDAAARFEKGLAPELAKQGLERIVTLIKQLIPAAEVISKIVDVNYEKNEERDIEFDLDFIRRRLGVAIDKKEVVRILESLHFKVLEKKEHFTVTPPDFRTKKDISLPEDIVEEVARIYGFDNIAPHMPLVSMEPQEFNNERLVERKVKSILADICGFTEVSNYSFMGARLIEPLGFDLKAHLEVKNYLTEDQRYLRTSLLPFLLKNTVDNLRFFKDINLFEIGRVFKNETGEYHIDATNKVFLSKQEKYLAGLSAGSGVFYRIKGAVERLLENLAVDYKFHHEIKAMPKFLLPSRCLDIVVNDQIIGYLGELSNDVLAAYNINKPVAYFESNFHVLLKYLRDAKKYQPLPKFPGITYDISVAVADDISWLDIEQAVLAQSSLIKKVELFDIYQLAKFGPDKKSLAFHVYFLDSNRTLTSKETDLLRDKIIKILIKKFKAEAR